MDIAEFEQRLHDAEIRLARLKSLYEQWFQGIERIEPQVARKELERAIEALRREQPRNTALRFRCQQLIARYGTYGIYWGRIAKQIEDGTYRRDLQRARNRIQAAREEREEHAYEVDLEEGLEGFDDSDLDAILGALTSDAKPKPAREPQVPSGPRTFARTRDHDRSTEPAPPGQGEPAGESGPATQPAPPPMPAAAPRPGAPLPPRPGVPPIPGGSPTPSAAPPAVSAKPPPPPGTPAGPTRVPPVPPPPKPPAEAAPGAPVGLAIGRMVRPAVPTPATGGVREEAGLHSRSGRPGGEPERPAAPAPAARPVPARPMPSAPAAPPRPAPQASPEPDIRALYDRYVEARRKNNERVDNVRFETLQQSVEKMIPKLREKHGNKAIEFDVVLQDGKVGLKPKVRG